MKETEFYKPEDIASKLDVNIMTIYRYIKSGKIKAYRIGKGYRIAHEDFISFLESVSTQ
jgi:putative resolvase